MILINLVLFLYNKYHKIELWQQMKVRIICFSNIYSNKKKNKPSSAKKQSVSKKTVKFWPVSSTGASTNPSSSLDKSIVSFIRWLSVWIAVSSQLDSTTRKNRKSPIKKRWNNFSISWHIRLIPDKKKKKDWN